MMMKIRTLGLKNGKLKFMLEKYNQTALTDRILMQVLSQSLLHAHLTGNMFSCIWATIFLCKGCQQIQNLIYK